MTFAEAKRYLLARADREGIDLEVLVSETRELTLETFEGELSQIVEATQGGIGLRAVVAGRTGYASTEERSSEALDWAFDEAVDNARIRDEGTGFLPPGTALGHHDLLGEGLSAPLEAKARSALDLEAALREDPRTQQVPITRYTEREVIGVLGSTRGADGGYRNGIGGLMTSLVMRQDSSLKQGFQLDFEKEFHALDPGRTARAALQRTGRLLGASQLSTGRYRAYLEPRVVMQLLQLLLFTLSGKSLMEKKSPFAGRIGEKVAADIVTLTDDPDHPEGLGNRPFDSEGTPAQATTLIDSGVLAAFLHNSETAAWSGAPNRGNARRSYKGTLGVGASNLILAPGTGIELAQGILVVNLMGLHAGANPISGDFSLQGLGLEIDGGAIGRPVENFAVSGNLYDLLLDIVALGSELEWQFVGTSLAAPMIEVAELSFAGS